MAELKRKKEKKKKKRKKRKKKERGEKKRSDYRIVGGCRYRGCVRGRNIWRNIEITMISSNVRVGRDAEIGRHKNRLRERFSSNMHKTWWHVCDMLRATR